MGLLDVDLLNQIRRELDNRYGKGVKILFGEPWAAGDTAIEDDAPRALRENINLLDENIGMFCDLTRDAVKGSSLKIKRPGFITGASGYENDIAESAAAWGENRCFQHKRRAGSGQSAVPRSLPMSHVTITRLCGINWERRQRTRTGCG